MFLRGGKDAERSSFSEVYGESGKNKTVVQGWANIIMEKDVIRLKTAGAPVQKRCIFVEVK